MNEIQEKWYIRFWLFVVGCIVFWLIGIDDYTLEYTFVKSFWGMILGVIPLFNGVYSLAILKNNMCGVDISRHWQINKAIWYVYFAFFWVWLMFFNKS